MHCQACGKSVLERTCAGLCNEWPTGNLVHDCTSDLLFHEICFREDCEDLGEVTFHSPFDFVIGRAVDDTDGGDWPIGKVVEDE